MYILSLLRKNKVVRSVEYYEAPTTRQIEQELEKEPEQDGLSFDIARKPLEEEDFDEHLEEI